MNISRRHLFQTTALIVGTVASAAVVPAAFAQDRSTGSAQVTKQAAQYQDQPNGQQRCSLCSNFQAPSACLVVSGAVSPNGWCKLFKPNVLEVGDGNAGRSDSEPKSTHSSGDRTRRR